MLDYPHILRGTDVTQEIADYSDGYGARPSFLGPIASTCMATRSGRIRMQENKYREVPNDAWRGVEY